MRELFFSFCSFCKSTQIQKSSLRAGKVTKVFITHLHGDHLFGLPGFLCTLGNNVSPDKCVHIYGPLGVKKYIVTSLTMSSSPLPFRSVIFVHSTVANPYEFQHIVRCVIHELVPRPDQFVWGEANLDDYRLSPTDAEKIWSLNQDLNHAEEVNFDASVGGWTLCDQHDEATGG
jgi:ribonuclease BN (tRNA processing enzyme)